MSDEEKKAIEKVKLIRDDIFVFIKNHGWIMSMDRIIKNDTAINSINILLNLVEKQQKEIEDLKAISEYREKIIKGLGLKTLPKTITGFKELIENNDKKWEDKIKAKIEELEKDLKEYENGQEWEIQDEIRGQIEVLQSLLEKE